jgi:hypothetical protein
MTLPEVCPLDENQKCKGRECHLFCLEWRTREPTCLIGYSTTSKVKSWKDDRKQDTYAEDTFRKLGKQSASKKKNVSEKGDWVPTRLAENPQEKPVQRREERSVQNPVAQKSFSQKTVSQNPISQRPVVSNPAPKPEIGYDRRPQERHVENEEEAEKAFMRLEARLKKEPVEEKPIIYGKIQTKVQEKPRVSEKVVSSNKHTTIFTSSDKDEKNNSYPPDREEKTKKPPENKEKRRKLDEIMEIDTPEVYDEEFWS